VRETSTTPHVPQADLSEGALRRALAHALGRALDNQVASQEKGVRLLRARVNLLPQNARLSALSKGKLCTIANQQFFQESERNLEALLL
jgi:hypothetical protein